MYRRYNSTLMDMHGCSMNQRPITAYVCTVSGRVPCSGQHEIFLMHRLLLLPTRHKPTRPKYLTPERHGIQTHPQQAMGIVSMTVTITPNTTNQSHKITTRTT